MIKRLLFVVAVLTLALPLHAQEVKDNLGREFYIVFGKNTGGEQGQETDNVLALYITSKVPTTGRVRVPALDFDRTFTTVPGTITTIPLPDGNNFGPTVAIQESETILKGRAVHVTADQEIAVFGLNHKLYSSDAFMALPVDVLGTEYRAMSYPASTVGQGASNIPGQFQIVAIEDSSHVTIIPKSRTRNGKPINSLIEIVLNKGDVYQLQSAGTAGSDLTGSLIESDQPIAVFSGHERTETPRGTLLHNGGFPSRDHLCEQLPPVSAWGDSAFVVPFVTSQKPDLVRVISAEDNNTISINNVPVATLNAGQFYEIPELTQVLQIEGTNPILVGQYLHTSWGGLNDPVLEAYGDPGLALVFPVEQFTTSYTILSIEDADSYTGNFVNIVVEASGVPSMKINGVPIPASEFKPIPNTIYVYAQITVEQGTHNLTGDKPFGVTVYGLGGVDSYAYTGGTLTKTITPLKSNDLVIDFGDRVLNCDLSGYFDTTVVLKNTSTEVVNVFSFPKRTQDTSKFHVVLPQVPYSIAPTQVDSMTIRFQPGEVNRRMKTKIIAKTDHLRAYVVDVLGRGVIEVPRASTDSLLRSETHVIDFGFFTRTDPPSDTVAFIGNLGLADLQIEDITITGPNKDDFTLEGIIGGEGPQLLPVPVAKSPSSPAKLLLRFTPRAPNGDREALLTYTTKQGCKTGTIKLLAQVFTVELATTLGTKYPETPLCKPGEQMIKLRNPNTIAIRVDSIRIQGANPDDFTVQRAVPFEIPPMTTMDVKVRFEPNDVGPRSATAVTYFNIPKGLWRTAPLSGVGVKIPLEYHMPRHIRVLTGEEFLLPIYADVDLELFGATGYTLYLRYDPTHLEDIDVELENTLSQEAAIDVGGTLGEREIKATILNNGKLTGGGEFDKRPLLYIKFKSFLAPGESPFEFQEDLPIHFNVKLKDKSIEDFCISQKLRLGIVGLDSTCADIYVVNSDIVPQQTYLAPNHPNPFNPSTEIRYDVAEAGYTRVEIYDLMGRVVQTLVDGYQVAGSYKVTFDATGLPSGAYTARLETGGVIKTRRMLLTK